MWRLLVLFSVTYFFFFFPVAFWKLFFIPQNISDLLLVHNSWKEPGVSGMLREYSLGFERRSSDRVTGVAADFPSMSNKGRCLWPERCWQAQNWWIFVFPIAQRVKKEPFHPECALGIHFFNVCSLNNSVKFSLWRESFPPFQWDWNGDGAEENVSGILCGSLKSAILGRCFSWVSE